MVVSEGDIGMGWRVVEREGILLSMSGVMMRMLMEWGVLSWAGIDVVV